jgi:hypothetical protein
MNIRIQNPHRITFLGKSCRQIHSHRAFTHAAFAADDRDFVLDFAHAYAELFKLFFLLQKPLPSGFHQILVLVRCTHKNHQTNLPL